MQPGMETVPEKGRIANAVAVLIFAETGDQVRETLDNFGLVLVDAQRLTVLEAWYESTKPEVR